MFNIRFNRIDTSTYSVYDRTTRIALGVVVKTAPTVWTARRVNGGPDQHDSATRQDAAAWIATHTFTTRCDLVATH